MTIIILSLPFRAVFDPVRYWHLVSSNVYSNVPTAITTAHSSNCTTVPANWLVSVKRVSLFILYTLSHTLSLIVDYRNCSVVRDNCEVIFRVDQFVLATEESIDIVIDTSNRDYQMWVENAGEWKFSVPKVHVEIFTHTHSQ